MSLSASMYSGTSGLKAHGEEMSVIGNNISNVSTVGYKGARMYFEDSLSQEIFTASGVGQVGRGVSIGAVMGDFSQGSLENTTEATDVAIGGAGFFAVSPAGQDVTYYTRAGNFRFDKQGYLVDPHGYRVQGWAVQQATTTQATAGTTTGTETIGVKIKGVPTDIKLDSFQSAPDATSRVEMVLNLDSGSEDRSVNTTTPFQALFGNYKYDSTRPEDSPLVDSNYAYQSTIKVYDENGSSHNLTVYMDPVNDSAVGAAAGGKQYWEYIVTVPVTDDNRELWSSATLTDTTKKGVLMAGTLTFNAAGEMEGMSAYTLNADPTNSADMVQWTAAPFSQAGYPICTPNFMGSAQADFTNETNAKNIEINLGMLTKEGNWVTPGATLASDTVAAGPPAVITVNNMANKSVNALSTTSYATGSTTIFQSQNGYTAGFLQNISVDRDGVITGNYSNGQVLQLFALTLATFNNNYALYREGGNLFSETRSSGPPITGLANTGIKGSIASNSLEQSNVDLATEFVKMITTEKGFQANSKTITTVDGMLSVLIQLKR